MDDGDLVTGDFVSFYDCESHRRVLVVPDGVDWRVAVSEWMEGEGFFGNVWRVDDHGGTELVRFPHTYNKNGK